MSFPDQTNSSLCANCGHWQLPFSSYSNRFESELEGLDCSSESIASQQIPKWWLWMYYLTPTSWTLKGMLTSQYGDVHTEIMVFGETKTISDFLRDYFGYHYHDLHIVGAVLIRYPLVFASLFAICIEKLNFQRR